MPFITQGKTNLKYILIVVILAVIIGGGILVYQYWWAPKEVPKIPEVKPPERIIEDETADWKVYLGEGDGISFRLRYPPHFKTIKEEFDSIGHIIGNDFSLYEHGDHKDGGVSILINNSEEMTMPVLIALKRVDNVDYRDYQDVLFSGIKVQKAMSSIPEENVGIVTYYINDQPPIDSNRHFIFDCRFFPASNAKLQKTCENIAATFEFREPTSSSSFNFI